jgi:hypothetical protein
VYRSRNQTDSSADREWSKTLVEVERLRQEYERRVSEIKMPR